jgi:photosystem II stability/assembly factor-like uncharacterized protein
MKTSWLGVGLILLLGFLVPVPRQSSEIETTPGVSANGSWNLTPEQLSATHEAFALKRQKLDSQGPKRFDQPDKAAEFFHRQRLADGETELPVEHMIDQLDAIKAREAMTQDGAAPGGIQGWQSIGPGNIGGRTRAIVVNPVDTGIMYAAGVAGGVFKSTDGGESWVPTSDFMLNLAVSTLVMDPADPNTLYAGTGEGFGTGSPFVRGLGIFKTTDAGASWGQLSGTVNGVPVGSFYYVNKIVISPNNPNRLYAGTRYGVFRSLDAGETWSPVLRNPWYLGGQPATNGCTLGCTDLKIRSDRNPDVLFAAFGSSVADGLYRSDDGGNTWTWYNMGSYQGRMTISIAPSDNDVIYVAIADNGGLNGYGRIAGLFRADDGVNFQPVLDWQHKFSPWLFSYVSIATGCFDYPYIISQGWYDNIIAADPVDPYKVWVGGINLYRSDDGGQTFGIAAYWFFYLSDPQPPIYVHPDQHSIVFHPDFDGVTNQTMYVGNDGGLFRTLNARAATSQEECAIGEDPGPPPDIAWEHINNGYAVTQYYHGDVARDMDMFIGGAQDNGSSRGLSVDEPNNWKMVYGGDGGYVAIDPTNSNIVFIEIQGFPTILKSVNAGDDFFPATNGITDADGLFITPFAMDPSDPLTLWTGGTRPWRTTNGGLLWTLAGPNIPTGNKISAIAVAPSDGNIVYLGFSNGYLARTTDGLSGSPTWSVFTQGVQPGAWVSSAAVDPADPDVAYCTYSTFGVDHVLRTTNGGTTWTPIDGIAETGVPDIPVHWIAVRPSNSQQLYVGTEFGVFASDDAGSTWEPANEGGAHTVVEVLDFQDDNTLVAFTHGRGVFVTNLESSTSVVEAPSEGRLTLTASPNPFQSDVAIRAWLPHSSPILLTIHDVSGRLVQVLHDGHHEAGTMTFMWDGRSRSGERVAAGPFFARLVVNDVQVTRRIVLAR